MRNKKEVKIGGEKYEVHELRVGDIMKILPRLSKEDEAQDATLDLMKLCVYQDGKPMGDAIEDIGLSTYMKLTDPVMEVNGLLGKS